MLTAALLDLCLSLAPLMPVEEPLPPGAIVRLGTGKLGHHSPVAWVGFSPDGRAAMTASSALRFWDVKTGRESASYYTYGAPRSSFALSPDSTRLLLLHAQDDVVLLDVAARRDVRTFRPGELFGSDDKEGFIARFTISPGGRFFAFWDDAFHQNVSWGDNKKRKAPFLHVWDLEERRLVHEWKTGEIYETEFTPDGRTLVAQEKTKEGDSSLVAWDLASGKEVRRFNLPRALNRFTFFPDGRSFIGLDGERMALHRYDAKTGKELAVLLDDKKRIFSFALSPDGQRFAVVQPSRVCVHRIATGNRIREWPTNTHADDWYGSMPELVAFSPDGKTLAAADSRRLALWDLDTGARRHADDSNSGPLIGVHAHGPNVLVRDMDFGVSLWDLRTGKLRRRYESEPPKLENGAYSPLYESLHCGVGFQAVSPDGSKVAALWPNAPMQLIDLVKGNAPLCFEESELAPCLAFSPDGKLLAAPLPDGRIGAWDTTTGKRVRHFEPRLNSGGSPDGRTSGFRALRFTADGRSLFGSNSSQTHHHRYHSETSEIMIWEMATGGMRRHVESALFDGPALAFINASNGKHIAVAGLRTILLFDVFTAKEVRRFGGSSDVVGHSAAFSPDGKLLAAGLDSGGIRFWEVATGTVLGDARAHKSLVTALAFADAGTLVTASIDGSAIAWDLERLLGAAIAAPNRAADAEFEKLWTELGHHDAEKAAPAMAALAARPQDAVAFFQRRLQPAPGARPGQIAQWLADLRSEQYAVRQRASMSLEKLGGHARAGLEKAHRDAESIEERRRIESLLHKLDAPLTDANMLRAVRAIEVLERIGDAGARRLLDGLAAGGPGHRLTADARASVARLTR